jgi:hypothetical protein
MGDKRVYLFILGILALGLSAFVPAPTFSSLPVQPFGEVRSQPFLAEQGSKTNTPTPPPPSNSTAEDPQPIYALYSTARTCPEIWGIHQAPPFIPAILEMETDAEDLYSNVPYYYLAAMLIQNQVVSAQDCPGNGLQSPFVANTCGVERARPALTQWQNMYNEDILLAARNAGIPPRLLKRLFAVESQFWPGIYNSYESGFGQLNPSGADTLLLYNPPFFERLCISVMPSNRCAMGYASLLEEERQILRGALVRQVNATCTDCPAGINSTVAKNSIPIFAELLRANCAQVAQILFNVYKRSPAQVSNYIDLWKLTLVNYHAGPGCTIKAVQRIKDSGEVLSWESIKTRLNSNECNKAESYIARIFE